MKGEIVPELPEVEVTRCRLAEELVGKRITGFVSRVTKLRLPVPEELVTLLPGLVVGAVVRRGKYLLLDCGKGWLLIHLGMSGFLRLLDGEQLPGRHDHLDIFFEGGLLLRFHDPRKFGIVTWIAGDPREHPLLKKIGPEPLSADFDGDYLFMACSSRSVAIKLLIMNSAIVAGVGNIYANEALFRACILPDRQAGTLTRDECRRLSAAIRTVLEESITAGSSFRVAEETVSYHPLQLKVYGRRGASCSVCGTPLKETRLGNRSTVFCTECQK
jgi:formamidopyrimidine-DNA glycosylase